MVEREELHRRITLLREAIEEGRVGFAEHLVRPFREDLSQVRVGLDGLVDPESVSARIRSAALAIAHLKWREEEKEAAPLRQVQEVYFELVESLFGETHELMKQAGTTPGRFASWFVSIPDQVDGNDDLFREFLDRVEAFWNDLGQAAWIHLEDARHLKAVFSGEPFPNVNPVSGAGLYVDTVVLPDPFVRLAPVLRLEAPKARVQQILRYALAVLEYRELALAELEVPLLVVLPDRHHLEEHYRELVHHVAGEEAAHHAGRVAGVEFSGADEAKAFFEQLESPESVVAVVQRPELVLFSDDWVGQLEAQIHRNWEEYGERFGFSVGLAFWANFYNRYSQVTDLLRRSTDLRGSPLIHATTVWRWLQWKLEANAYAAQREPGADTHIVRTLSSEADGSVTWLGKIPPAALIEIRKVGALEELRQLIGAGVDELATSAPADFGATGRRVVANLSKAISDHREAVKALRRRNLKFAGVDVASFLVVGTIELAAVAAGTPLFGAAAVAASMSGYVPSAKELKATSDALVRESELLQRGPVGILMRHVDVPETRRRV